jgi:hypothetical protein
MTIAEMLFVAVLGLGIYKLLGPFQDWLEKTLLDFLGSGRTARGRIIDVEPEPKKKGS